MARGLWLLAWWAGICKARPKDTDSSPRSRSSGHGTQGKKNHDPCHAPRVRSHPRGARQLLERVPH